MKNTITRALTLVAVLAATFAGSAHAGGSCATTSFGGDWPSYGHDLSNTRTQNLEDKINASNAGSLAADWTVDLQAIGGTGAIQSTPIVANGCMFVATTTGYLVALNADSGEVVWSHQYTAEGSFGGMWSPSVVNGVLYAIVSNDAATNVVAVEATTGNPIWSSAPVATDPGSFSNAGAVVFDNLIFVGLSGAEGGHSRSGGWAMLDARNGDVLLREFTVPDSDYAIGYSGGSMWGTAAVDTQAAYLYEGTGQPSNSAKRHEHQYTNAIVKIDVARARDAAGNPLASGTITNPKFGKIVDAYKGLSDYGHAPLDGNAPCQVDENGCVLFDTDFGASPNLFTNSRGYKMVGAYQKTGIYHAVYADTLTRAWTNTMSQMVGPPYLANAASSAFDGKQIINVGSHPGQMVAAEKDFGAYNWVAPTGGVTNYNPTETANGVAYVNDSKGFLHAYDTATGLPVLAHPMEADTGTLCTGILTSGGAAIARNTVYSTCGSWVIAYRLP
jgi:polyvinyl alcohol dehydrogenase (cytochrome)